MQQRLFGQDQVEMSSNEDPYQETHEASSRLAAEYAIDSDEAFDMILGFGSESAARRALKQRWWLGEVELRTSRAA